MERVSMLIRSNLPLCILQFHHRDPGLVGLLASDQIPKESKLFYGIIADGNHTHPSTTRIAYRANTAGIVLVTDACSAMGLQDGTHHIGQQAIDVRGTKAVIKGTDTLCGSVATMTSCVQYFLRHTGKGGYEPAGLSEYLSSVLLNGLFPLRLWNRECPGSSHSPSCRTNGNPKGERDAGLWVSCRPRLSYARPSSQVYMDCRELCLPEWETWWGVQRFLRLTDGL